MRQQYEILSILTSSQFIFYSQYYLFHFHYKIFYYMSHFPNSFQYPLNEPFLNFNLHSSLNFSRPQPIQGYDRFQQRLTKMNHSCTRQTSSRQKITKRNSSSNLVYYKKYGVGDGEADQQSGYNQLSYLVQLIQAHKQKTRELLHNESKKIREQIWLKIEWVFRRVESAMEDKYQQMVNSAYSLRGYDSSTKNLVPFLSQQQHLEVQNRMEILVSRNISALINQMDIFQKEVENLFEKDVERIKKVFFQEEQIQDLREKDFIQNRIRDDGQMNDKNGKGNNIKQLNSLQKQKPREIQDRKCISLSRGKNIEAEKLKKTFSPSKKVSLNHDSEKQYYTNQNTVKPKFKNINIKGFQYTSLSYDSEKQAKPESSHKHKYFFGNRQQTNVTSRYDNLIQNTSNFRAFRDHIKSRQIAKSPALSKMGYCNSERKVGVSKYSLQYNVGQSQQNIACEWCQQIKVDSQIRTSIIFSHQNQAITTSKNKLKQENNSGILCLHFCNNFLNLAFGSKNSFIYIYQHNLNQMNHRFVTRLQGHESAICCLSSYRDILFSGSDFKCCSIILWSTVTWTIRSKINIHSAGITSILNVPNTDLIISCGFDKKINLYNYSTSQIIDRAASSIGPYTKLIYHQNLQKVALCCPENSIDIYQVEFNDNQAKLIKQRSILCKEKVTTIQKAQGYNKQFMAVGLSDGSIELFSIPEYIIVKKIRVVGGVPSSILTITRESKLMDPLICYSTYSSKSFFLLNCETQYIKQINVKGNVELCFVQGINPIMAFSNRNSLVWVSHNIQNPCYHSLCFTIY